MGRYGNHHNRKKFNVSEDFDSSNEQPEKPVTQDWDSQTEKRRQNIIENLKERYKKYNSPDARQQRRSKTLEKRERKIEDLTYKAKKEKLSATVRRSQQTAPRRGFGSVTINMPKHNYGSMDRMFGIGGSQKPAKTRPVKKQQSNWSSFDRMFGL